MIIGEALLHLHSVGAHDFSRLPSEIAPDYGAAQFYAAILHAMMNDSRRMRVERHRVSHLWIDGRVIAIAIPHKDDTVATFVRRVLQHDQIVRALFRNGDAVVALTNRYEYALMFKDPSPLVWADLIHAGRELEQVMQPVPFASKTFYAARKKVVEALASKAALLAANASC